ncbi:MAG: hypothetical protein RDU89_04425 [bacterium]|nr:hypothetical protein [bacterium]
MARAFGHSVNAALVDSLVAPGADAGRGTEAEAEAFDLGRRLARAARKLEPAPEAY